MKSLRELYRIGMGPSSSHTMAPRRAAERFAHDTPDAVRYRVTLQGSLAATGKGHLTDRAVALALPPDKPLQIVWAPEVVPDVHPNGMLLEALDAAGHPLCARQVYSPGGGALLEPGADPLTPEVYSLQSAAAMLAWAEREGSPLWRLAFESESRAGIALDPWLRDVWQTMLDALTRGLACEDPLPGPLRLRRRARTAYTRSRQLNDPRTALISAYALAVAEENAAGGVVATAPTCGSSGVVPGLFRFLVDHLQLQALEIYRALATAGLFGNLIKHNASISGAAVGCQGEVGAACAMAAAGAAQLLGGTPHQIECAAEMALEHHLGLTCDPMAGLVQIPCIERNAMAAMRALTCAEYALLFDGRHRVSFDQVVETMNQTGRDLPSLYRETSTGGLARWFAADPAPSEVLP